MIRRTLVLLILLALAAPAAAAEPTRVMVVASMHGLHKTSRGYPYEALYALVRGVKPDYVGVEIREEDLGRGEPYLAANYPHEMIALARQWKPHAFGFDWLGDNLAGAPVPGDWWAKQSPVKRLERELDKDKALDSPVLDRIREQEMAILKTATASSLNDGRYDRLNDDYYRILDKMLAGTRYAPITDFYSERDLRIARNIEAALRAHPGKTLVVVLGADHRSFVVRYLREHDPKVRMLPVEATAAG